MLLCCFFRPRIVDDEPNGEQQLKKGKRVKKEKKKKRGMKRGKLEEQVKQTKAEKEEEEKKEVEEVAVTEEKVEKKQEMGEEKRDGVEKELLLEEVSMERVEEVKMDLERVTEELKDEETSLKEEQVEEPVPADPLDPPLLLSHTEVSKGLAHPDKPNFDTLHDSPELDDAQKKASEASKEEIQETTAWCKDLLLNTIPSNAVSKLEDREMTAISTHFKNSGNAQHLDYELLLLMKLKRKWAGKFSEMSAVRRPLVHPLTSCLRTGAPVDPHVLLNPTVDSTLKEEVKQVDTKRKWMKRLRQRAELKKLPDSTDDRPTDVSDTEKRDLLLNTTLANAVWKLEDKEAKAISTHFKNSGDAQCQDYELLLMKMKRKWAGKFSEMSAVSRPLVHHLTSCHHIAPVVLHLHLNSTVDSTLKDELKQMDMKRKWMERLRQREELKKLSGSSDSRPTDVSHTEKSVQSQP